MTARPIRQAGCADLPALLELVHAAYRGDIARRGWTHEADLLGGQRTDADALGKTLDDPHAAILLTEGDSALAGCVQVTNLAGAGAYLGLLSVHPDLQASGLGRRLIEAAEHHARNCFGARRMEMTVIKQRGELIRWYERRGYRLTGEERPFPLDDPRFGLPVTRELNFVVLDKALQPS